MAVSKCSICGNDVELINGRSYCKTCKSVKDAEYYQANRERLLSMAIQYYWDNREVAKARVRSYSIRCRDKCNALSAKRRAQKKNAIPSWSTKEDIKSIASLYSISRERTDNTGVAHVVDHIIPLQGREVCGLHTTTNLRVITAEENAAKSNKLLEEHL